MDNSIIIESLKGDLGRLDVEQADRIRAITATKDQLERLETAHDAAAARRAQIVQIIRQLGGEAD